MRRSAKKLFVELNVSLADLAAGVVSENDYSDVIDFIEEIDRQQQDWEFTYQLKELVDKLMAEEDGTRVNSKPGHESCDLDRTCTGGPYKCLQEM